MTVLTSALTRRTLLAGTACAGAVATSVSARVPPAQRSRHRASKHQLLRYKVGDFEITQVTDGASTFPMPDGFVVNASKDQAIAAAEAAYMPSGKVTVPFNPIIINTGTKLVAIDTGGAAVRREQGRGRPHANQSRCRRHRSESDRYRADLAYARRSRQRAAQRDGGLVFPNAEIKVAAPEWAFWMNDDNMGKANPFNKAHFPIARKPFDGIADKVTRYDWGRESPESPRSPPPATPPATPRSRSPQDRRASWFSPT